MLIKADFIVGKNSLTSWSGVYGFKPEDSIEPIELFAVIKLQSSSDQDRLESLGKFFLDELQNYLFVEGKETNYIVRLENAVWKMKSKMDFLLSSDPKYSQSGLDIEMSLCLFDKDFLYMGVIGESKIFIRRADKFVDLSNNLTDANMMGFFKTGSMLIEPKDRIALTTGSIEKLGVDLVEYSLESLNINRLESIKEEQNTAVLILADESDNWYVFNSIEEESVIDGPLNPELEQIIAEESRFDSTSGDEFPIQEEDFEPENSLTKPPISKVNREELGGLDPSSSRTLKIANLVNSGFGKIANKLKSLRQSKVVEDDESKSYMVSHNEELEPTDKKGALDFIKLSFLKSKDFISKLSNNFGVFYKKNIAPTLKSSNKTYIKYFRDFITFLIKNLKIFIVWFKNEFIGGGIEDRRNKFAVAKKRRRNRIILIVLTVIVLVLVINGINNRNAELKEQERQLSIKTAIDSSKSQFQAIEKQFNPGLELAKKESFATELAKINKSLDTQKKENLYLDEIKTIQKGITTLTDKLFGVVPVVTPNYIAEIGKLYADASLSDIVLIDGSLYVSDKDRGVIYKLSVNTGSAISQFVQGLKSPSSLTVNVSNNIIFFDADSSSAIGKIFLEDGRVERYAGLAPAVVGTITKAAVFSGNDALYEIHQNHQQLFKRDKDASGGYVGGGAVYNTQNPPNWKTDPELAKAIDIDIPYEVYILIEGRGIRRYLAGGDNTITADSFINTSQKDIESLSSATAIDIGDKMLAVADPANRRVLLFTIEQSESKNLVFEKSFVYKGSDQSTFKEIKELVIDETSKAIFVLDATSIVRIDY
jgi:hypothetical protein